MSSDQPSFTNPYEGHITPRLEAIVASFGGVHGEDLVREYAGRLLWINTCGGGLHPNDADRLIGQLVFSAEAVTTTLVIDRQVPEGSDGEFTNVVDLAAQQGLLGDEALTATLISTFTEMWPDGRDTVVANSGNVA